MPDLTEQHETFSTPGPASLYVELGSGDLVVHTADTEQTTVAISGDGAGDVVVEQRGEEISVLAKQRRTGFLGLGSQDLTVRVTVPHDSRLGTKLGSADTRVVGRIGESRLRSGSGDVRIEQVTADAVIETGSGDVTVERAHAALSVKAGSGDITLDRTDGPVTVATGSGDVTITAAEQDVQVRSGSGDLRIRDAQQDVALNTASGDLVVDLVHRGQLVAKNVSGDIRIGVPGGIPVWTDVSSITGRVASSLEGAGEPTEGQDFVELRAKTVSGDIRLDQR